MYGTVMIASAKPGMADQMVDATRRWLRDRAPRIPGFLDEWVLVGDDGVTLVAAVRFASKEDYQKLAEDPFQDAYWHQEYADRIEGEVRWVDGEWQELRR
jgi:hypothetical protein